MSYQARFKRWLASNTLGSSLVTVVEFSHSQITTQYITDYGKDTQVLLEDGTSYVTAQAVQFAFNLPKKTNSTKQELSLSVDNTSGIPYSMLKSVDPTARFGEPLDVVLRFYLDDDLLTPQLDPPIKLEVKNASVEGAVVQFRCVSPFLRREFTGMLYTPDLFPTLYSFWT